MEKYWRQPGTLVAPLPLMGVTACSCGPPNTPGRLRMAFWPSDGEITPDGRIIVLWGGGSWSRGQSGVKRSKTLHLTLRSEQGDTVPLEDLHRHGGMHMRPGWAGAGNGSQIFLRPDRELKRGHRYHIAELRIEDEREWPHSWLVARKPSRTPHWTGRVSFDERADQAWASRRVLSSCDRDLRHWMLPTNMDEGWVLIIGRVGTESRSWMVPIDGKPLGWHFGPCAINPPYPMFEGGAVLRLTLVGIDGQTSSESRVVVLPSK